MTTSGELNSELNGKEAIAGPDLSKCVAIGGEMGTSASKFCCDDTIVIFTSVVGDALSANMEKSWRMMNRSSDNRWIKNLAIFDDSRNAWRYVGAMTRSSEKTSWFTHKGLIQNYDDAFLAIKAGLFLLSQEMEKKGKPIEEAGFGFGITVRHGENILEKFLAYMKEHLAADGEKKFVAIKAKNVATGEVREISIQLDFSVMQYQAYGAYMALLFSKYNMDVYNTYIIDIGHGTWIKLPIIDNEAEINLADSLTEGIYTITKNISETIFESSEQKFKIPEQRIMQRLPLKDFKIEIPGIGVYDFSRLLAQESLFMGRRIMEHVARDITALSQKGQTIEYFTIIGGGAHLLYDTIKSEIGAFFGWPETVLDERIIHPNKIGIDPRYINCVGFMLLARDHIALTLGKEVETRFQIRTILKDTEETGPDRGKPGQDNAPATAKPD
ncbi:MAG TPA: hypothetical protein VJZ49_08830 [Syntrophales bacterium]|nr:hypothetical protein [Syntrophales bacterium]